MFVLLVICHGGVEVFPLFSILPGREGFECSTGYSSSNFDHLETDGRFVRRYRVEQRRMQECFAGQLR